MYKDSILSFLKNGKYKSTYPCETFLKRNAPEALIKGRKYLIQGVISAMLVSDIKKEEEITSSNLFLYFLIKGEIFTKNVQYREFSDTVDGPLNILNKNNITNIDKNIVLITITAVSESVLLQISIDEINKAKKVILQRDINDFKYSDLLMKHLTRLQIEKMNKYMTRRVYRRNEYVFREGEIPNEIFFTRFDLQRKERPIQTLRLS